MTKQLPHICFLAPNAFPLLAGSDDIEIIGGAELQQVTVARYLAARGYPISMVCLNFGQRQHITIDGINVVRAFRPNEGVPILRFIWPRLTSIWKCLKRVDADIYYKRTADVWAGVMVRFCKLYGKRSIFAAAGNPDLEVPTPRIRYVRDRWIYAYGLRHVDCILTQNEEQARLCEANFGRVSISIPNCYPAPTNRTNGAKDCILWVSTIRRLKRPDLFLDLANALPQFHFRMVGGPGHGEADLFESIKARADKMRNLEFLGFVPYSRVDEQFDRATLFVNTSESEGFPNSFLQAWARGIPTVSFINAGASLEGKPIGLRAGSLHEMITIISELNSNELMRTNEGGRCTSYFQQNHLPETIVSLYGRVFGELMKSRPQFGLPPFPRTPS